MKRRTFLPVVIGFHFAASGVAWAQGDGDEGARRQAMEAAERAKRDKAMRPAPAQVQPARPPEQRRSEPDRRGAEAPRRDDRRGDPRYVQEAPRNDWRHDGRPDGHRDGRWDGNRRGYRDDPRHWGPQTRHDWRGAGPGYRYYRGDHLPYEYRQHRYLIQDWRPYYLYAPPRGYYWVHWGDDFLLVEIATGLIVQILLGN